MRKDPYKVLGVDRTATDDEIKSAYRELAKKYHPDNYVGSPLADLAQEKMKEINEAYDKINRQRQQEKERMVKTPWFEHAIPFHEAARIGTQKVIEEHSTIGLVITSDGSFGELPRENFPDAEEKTIQELKKQ